MPDQVLTDNGKVFTGRLFQPPVEVLFDRICRENGIDHILTTPYSPTTTGKIERFHKTMRLELDTRRVFKDLQTAQEALDEWVDRNAGSACDILVKNGLLQFWVGSELVKTAACATHGVVRKKNAEGHAPRH